MKRFKSSMVVVLVATLILGVSVWSFADKTENTGEEQAESNAIKVIVTGQNYCVACTLKKEGAKGECRARNCSHALEVTSAKTVDGKNLEDMKGWTLHYLDTKVAKEYIKDHHYEKVTITGTVYLKQRVLEVSPQA